jgi:hypothetical protein
MTSAYTTNCSAQLRDVLSAVIFWVIDMNKTIYHMQANISHGLYIFYPIFQCGLYCGAVNITDNICTKQPKIGLKIRCL